MRCHGLLGDYIPLKTLSETDIAPNAISGWVEFGMGRKSLAGAMLMTMIKLCGL